MAFDDIPWDANQVVHSGDEAADGVLVYSTKNAQHIEALLAKIIIVLDHIDAN